MIAGIAPLICRGTCEDGRVLLRWIGSGCLFSVSLLLCLEFVGDCCVDDVIALWLWYLGSIRTIDPLT